MLKNLLSLGLVLALSVSLMADDADGKTKGRKKGQKESPAIAKTFAAPKGIELTEEQQKQLAELKAEYGPKLQELQKAANAALTPEQKKARAEARKAAVQAGKKGKELQEAVNAAVDIDADTKKAMEAAMAKMAELRKEVRQKMMSMLTKEQKQSLRGKGKKKKADDAE